MRHLCCLLLLPGLAYADPAPMPPEAPVVHLPETQPSPPAPPAPSPMTKLGKGQLYIVSSETPFLLVASRAGMVTVSTKTATPDHGVVIFGEFVDPKPGDEDGRTFTKGTVDIVKAVGVGQVEIIIATDLSGKNLTRRILDVNGGGPTPPPDPPPPTDPLTLALQAAYDTDTASVPNKSIPLALLALVYSTASQSTGEVFDAQYATTTDLAAAIHKRATAQIGTDLPKTRAAIGLYLNTTLGTTPVALDDAKRPKVASAYKAVAAALGGLK